MSAEDVSAFAADVSNFGSGGCGATEGLGGTSE